jgi:hypothetical protein
LTTIATITLFDIIKWGACLLTSLSSSNIVFKSNCIVWSANITAVGEYQTL